MFLRIEVGNNSGNPFWLVGVDTPIILKNILQNVKKIWKKI
jgi:hypothetical protein